MSRHSRMLRTQENNCNLPAPCRLLMIASIASLSVGCSPSEPPAERRTVDDAALSDDSQGENWLAFGRTYNEQRFSPLTQINDSNVGELAVERALAGAAGDDEQSDRLQMVSLVIHARKS